MESLDDKMFKEEKWEGLIHWTSGVLGFVAGAIAAGSLTHHLEYQNLSHVLTAGGALVGAAISLGIAETASEIYKQAIKDKKQEFATLMANDFTTQVCQYIAENKKS